jgi:hypothetical protein
MTFNESLIHLTANRRKESLHMSSLYLTAIMPNPPGRDRVTSSAARLNEEWVEFAAVDPNRNLAGDELHHLTFTSYGCSVTGRVCLERFGAVAVLREQRVRVHTGSGQPWWEGNVLHWYLGHGWFVWNNACGDRAVLTFNGGTLDWAEYSANPPERVLTRILGTNRFA